MMFGIATDMVALFVSENMIYRACRYGHNQLFLTPVIREILPEQRAFRTKHYAIFP